MRLHGDRSYDMTMVADEHGSSVMAVVSKAIFEKQAKRAGQLLAVGDVWATDRYVSANAALTPLAAGGSLYLVTVRPGDQLWFVAILVKPTFDGQAWTSAANTTPIADITALLGKLRFTSGKGIAAAPGKLGMSLQTPRGLTAADVALLAGTRAAPGPREAYAAGVLATGAAQSALAEMARLAATAKERGLVALRFANYKRWHKWSALGKAAKVQTEQYRGNIEEAEEFGDALEAMDVVDDATGRVVYQLYLWPFGSGVLFGNGESESLADVVQHHFQLHEPSAKLRESFAVAYHAAREPLGIRELVEFNPDPEETNPTPKPIPLGHGELAAKIAEWRRTGANPRPSALELWRVVAGALDRIAPPKEFHPIPLRRPSELTPLERDALELLADIAPKPPANETYGYFVQHGLPGRSFELMWFLGRMPATALDEAIELDGQVHPAWALVADAVYELRNPSAIIDRLVAALPAERAAAVWRALIEVTAYPIRYSVPTTRDDENRGIPAKKADAHRERFVDFMVRFGERLGERIDAIANELLELRRAQPRPDASELVTLLRYLARRGPLDARHDALIDALVRDQGRFYLIAPSVVTLLEHLPRERAVAIAGDRLELVAAFPSVAGGERVLRWLEEHGAHTHVPYYEPLLRRIFVDGLREDARAMLVEFDARTQGAFPIVQACLAKLDKAGKAKTTRRRG